MKHFSTIFSCILAILFAQAINAQNCSISTNLIDYYDEDIKSMAIEYMWQTQQDTNAVQIPEVHYNYVAKKVSAIFTQENNMVRDSIFDRYCIHDILDIHQSKQIVVFIDPAEQWTTAWMNLNEVSGNATIDQFIQDNQFQIESYVQLPYESSYGSHYVVLSNTTVVNAKGAINWLNQQEGVILASENNSFGGAGRIAFYEAENQTSSISFTHEWSDCGDGCDNMITWVYEVDADCNVLLIDRFEFHVWETWPDAPETNCNITLSIPTIQDNKWVVYPNPFDKYIEIEINSDQSNYEIYTIHGQKIKSGKLTFGQNKVDTNNLETGLYIVKIGSQSFKCLKRIN